MSPENAAAAKKRERSPIADRVLKVRSLTYKESADAVVIAHRDELIVHAGALSASPSFRHGLTVVAERVGSLAELLGPPSALVGAQGAKQLEPDYQPDPNGPLSEVELWRLKGTATGHSLDVSSHLRAIAKREVDCLIEDLFDPTPLRAFHKRNVTANWQENRLNHWPIFQ